MDVRRKFFSTFLLNEGAICAIIDLYLQWNEKRIAMLSKDGVFVSTFSALPDLDTQNSTEVYQKGYKSVFLCKIMISGNSETFLIELLRTLSFFLGTTSFLLISLHFIDNLIRKKSLNVNIFTTFYEKGKNIHEIVSLRSCYVLHIFLTEQC